MKAVKRGLAVFAIVLMLLGMIPTPASAEFLHATDTEKITGGVLINPLDGDLPVEEPEDPSGSSSDPFGEQDVLTTEEAVASIRQHLVNRDKTFSVTVPMPDISLNDYTWQLVRHAMDHTGVPDEGDYIYSQFSKINWDSEQTEDGLIVSITASYRTTRAQENQVDQKVAQILEELDLPRENDYESFRAVYDYLTSHVTYDSANPSIAHTAYGALIRGLAVCQGFAAALYRLCLEAGIDCRYCVSTAQKHAWNIVGLGGEYYLADSTWDRIKDETSAYRYCLNGTDDWLTRHFTSDSSMPTFGEGFYSYTDPNGNLDVPWFYPVEQYPLSKVSFEEGRHTLSVEYVYPDGMPAAEPYVEMLWPMDGYSVPLPSIEGYESSMSTVGGIMPGHDLSVTVEYVPEGHVHEWDAGTVTTAPTCTECGMRIYFCSCGAEKAETIAPAGHAYYGNDCTVCGLHAVAKGNIRGGNSFWTLESDGKLTVSGLGIMGVFSSRGIVSWASYREEITSVEIKEGVTTVCAVAFADCPNLGSVSLPEGMVSICRYAFQNCVSLTEIEIPDSVQILDKQAFLDSGLTSVSIGSGCYYFGFDCFKGCEELDDVSYAGTAERWCYADIKNEYGNPGYYASSFVMEGEELGQEVEIPDSVRKVRPNVFVNRNLTSVTFPETLERIGKKAFLGNTGLVEMEFRGDCPKAEENVINDASFRLCYPCANETWTEGNMNDLYSESHMPGCTLEEWCTEHLWDGGSVIRQDGPLVLRRVCTRCGEVQDVQDAETTRISLTARWEDHADWFQVRPEQVTVTVRGAAEGRVVYEETYTIHAKDNWKKLVNGLIKYNAGGIRIVYSVISEEDYRNYRSKQSGTTVTYSLEGNMKAEYLIRAKTDKGGVLLEWHDASGGNGSVQGGQTFEVYRRISKRTGSETCKQVVNDKWERIGTTTDNVYLDLKVELGTTYEYAVRTAAGRSSVARVTVSRPQFLPYLPFPIVGGWLGQF